MTNIDEVGYKVVPPDPSIADAVGRHHSLTTAIADLVDNCVDAGATRVLVRFLSHNGFVNGLRVIDDGQGMSAAEIDRAMTFGGKRNYDSSDLGHFGLGLKAASLSQSDQLDVLSLAHGAYGPIGRRILASQATRVAELEPSQVADALAEPAGQLLGGPFASGTVVEWRSVRSFLSSPSVEERTSWLEETIESLRSHLGLVLHRILARGDVAVSIDEFDTGVGMASVSRKVVPINPTRLTSRPTPSTKLRGEVSGRPFVLNAHLWPTSQKSAPQFRLSGLPGSRSQGFYVYRNDRLLQSGGWNGVVHGGRDYEFARIVLECDEAIAAHVTINPEKSGVEFDAELRMAISAAVAADGSTFRDYLESAEASSRASRRRSRRPITLSELRRGLSPDLRETLSETVTYSEHGSIEMRWKALTDGKLVEIDLERRTLWLNVRHRKALGSTAGEADDLPLIKMLLLLLYSRFFEGAMLGAREKDELLVWEELIDAALDEELERRSYGEEPVR